MSSVDNDQHELVRAPKLDQASGVQKLKLSLVEKHGKVKNMRTDNSGSQTQRVVLPPQILETSTAAIIPSTFDFNRIKKKSQKRKVHRLNQSLHERTLNTDTERQSKKPSSVVIVQSSNNVRLCNLTRVDLQQNGMKASGEEVLNPSFTNTALISSRIQSQEYKNIRDKGKPKSNKSLNEIVMGSHHDKQVDIANEVVDEVEQEGEESPLKAFKIARRQSIMNQMGLSSRRESLFGSSNIKTPDPLQKLLQTNKYLQGDQSSGVQTERMHSRRESYAVKASTNGTFKNELLSKTLNQHQVEIIEEPPSNKNLRTKTPSQQLDLIEKHVSHLNYRERLFIKQLQQQKQDQNKDRNFNKTTLNPLTFALPTLGKSPKSIINDTVQQAMVIEHIKEYNTDSTKYNSPLIHLGVLLKKAVSTTDQGHSIPCYFLTTICCQIFDKLTIYFPQFQKILLPLKNTLFQSIYYKYDLQKHTREDNKELEQSNAELDLTKKNPLIELKYMKYETYHDKYAAVLKENKELKKELAAFKQKFNEEKKLKTIVRNMASVFQRMKQKEMLKKVFSSLKYHEKQKYHGLFTQIISKKGRNNEGKSKYIMKKYYQEWIIYTKDSKLRKGKRELEYYQNKVDDLDDVAASQRVQIQDLTKENTRLKEILNEKNSKLAVHETEAIQMQMDTSKKKPYQIQQCLKVYFKYMFTNPLIARLRLKNYVNLGPMSMNDKQQSSQAFKVMKAKPQINLTPLLKKRETIVEGGPGLKILMDMSLRDIMVRWVNYMIERAILKLDPIIEILKREVSKKYQSRQSNSPGTNRRSIKQQRESSSDSNEGNDGKRKSQSDFFSTFMQLQKVTFEDQKDYEPFKDYKQDLRLLITFKEMISKVVTEFCKVFNLILIALNMIHDGVLQAILFAIDKSQRSIEVTNNVVVQTPTTSNPRSLKNYQFNEETVEEVLMHDYKSILLYVNDTDVERRSRMIIDQLERIQNSKFDWYFSINELLTGRETPFNTIFYYLFYTHSCLEQTLQPPLRMQKSSFNESQVQEEQQINLQVHKRILYNTRQKILPLLLRKVHQNLQDVSLLFNQEELQQHQGSILLQNLLNLPFMEPKHLMVRWANHLLRSFNELRIIYGLEAKFRQRFSKIQQEEEKKSPSRSPSRNDARPKVSSNAISPSPTKKVPQERQSSKSPTPSQRLRNQQSKKEISPDKNPGIRVQSETKTTKILKKLNPDLHDLGFEITKLKQLNQENYHRLVIILAFLSPETLWDMNDLDYKDIRRQPHLMELAENLLYKGSVESKHLFIMNAVARIAKKNQDLNDFGREQYEKLDDHTQKLNEQRPEITEAFAFIQDSDRIFHSIKEQLIRDRLNYPNPKNIIARQMKIYERSEILLSDIERSIYNLNRNYLFSLLTFRQQQQANQWISQIEGIIRKYLYPFRRYLNIYMDQDGFITYFDIWRAIKSLNIRTFNLDAREVENILIKLIKLKDNKVATRKNAGQDDENLNMFEDYDKDAELFVKKIKSEIQPGHRFRSKSSIVKEIEESLDNVYIKTQLYRAKFSPSDLIIVLIAILFRQNPTEFVRELVKIAPWLQEQGMKNVNKMLSKEKIQLHVEAYLTEYQPQLLFEQFLIHNVFIKSEFSKKHPFRFNMMKDDFRDFLDHYMNSLYGVFDFYLHEYSSQYPQHIKYKHFCIQVEAVYALLRDFNAFNPESGLTKNNLRKILTNIQMQVTNESKSAQIKTNPVDQMIGNSTPTNINQARSTSPINRTVTQPTTNDNQAAQIAQGFQSLVFFEFMELLYLVSQYYSPDPFVNPNQKFAEFLERIVFVNIQFKIKSKRLQDSPHKKNLIKSLENHKVKRGAHLETFNAYFDLN